MVVLGGGGLFILSEVPSTRLLRDIHHIVKAKREIPEATQG